MKVIPIEEAVGKALSHELTGIIPGNNQNITFFRGYIVKEEDLETLKNMGKYHIKVLDEDSEQVHENEAAEQIGAALLGKGCSLTPGKEGKVHGFAINKGLLRVQGCTLKKLNMLDGIKAATKCKNRIVEAGEKVATISITPLELEQSILKEGLDILEHPLVEVLPLFSPKVGIITTGNEVYEGRIKDAFKPYIKMKLEPFGYAILEQSIVPDQQEAIEEAMGDFIHRNFDIIFLTGGLSVDADDYTMKSVREYPDMEILAYGSPVFPGAMFLAAYYRNELPVIGLPAGLLRGGESILDRILPLVWARVKLNKEFIASLGEGGLL